MDMPKMLRWEYLGRALIKIFGTDKLLESPIRKLSIIKMRHCENLQEHIDSSNHIRHTKSNEPHITHTITWYVSRLSRGTRREMKKGTTYATLTKSYDTKMKIEDEYATFGDGVEVDLEVRKGKRLSIRGNSSPIQGSFFNIGVDGDRGIAREVSR